MSDKTIILITGANSGIGYATSKVIASASPSYHVIMAGRNLSKVDAALSEIQSTGGIKGKLSSVQLDVTDINSISAAAKKIEQDFGHIDVLINNAGVAGLSGDTKHQLDEILNTNVTGPILVSEVFMPLLEKGKNPYSIFISSGLGSLGLTTDPNSRIYGAGYDFYSLSKSALNMYVVKATKSWAKEKGIKVFAMCPGLVRSNLRGTSEDMVSAGGAAGDPEVSGQTILDILEGKRDAEIGQFITKDGIYPW